MPLLHRYRGNTTGSTSAAGFEKIPVAFFVLLAFGISWALWMPAAFGDSPSLLLLVFLGSLGPSLGAVLLTATNRQREGRA